MEEILRQLISSETVLKNYGLMDEKYYEKFISLFSERLQEITDKETSITELESEPTWLDGGGNIHSRFYLQFTRRDEAGQIGVTVVWLKRLKTFRSVVWSDFQPKSDLELFDEAKALFRKNDYTGYLDIAIHLKESSYSTSKAYALMNIIARKRAN